MSNKAKKAAKRVLQSAPKTVHLIALGNYSYARKALKIGDPFEASAAHGQLLVMAKRAKYADSPAPAQVTEEPPVETAA